MSHIPVLDINIYFSFRQWCFLTTYTNVHIISFFVLNVASFVFVSLMLALFYFLGSFIGSPLLISLGVLHLSSSPDLYNIYSL